MNTRARTILKILVILHLSSFDIPSWQGGDSVELTIERIRWYTKHLIPFHIEIKQVTKSYKRHTVEMIFNNNKGCCVC